MSDRYTGLAGIHHEVSTLPYGDWAKLAICHDCGCVVAEQAKHDLFHDVDDEARDTSGEDVVAAVVALADAARLKSLRFALVCVLNNPDNEAIRAEARKLVEETASP